MVDFPRLNIEMPSIKIYCIVILINTNLEERNDLVFSFSFLFFSLDILHHQMSPTYYNFNRCLKVKTTILIYFQINYLFQMLIFIWLVFAFSQCLDKWSEINFFFIWRNYSIIRFFYPFISNKHTRVIQVFQEEKRKHKCK